MHRSLGVLVAAGALAASGALISAPLAVSAAPTSPALAATVVPGASAVTLTTSSASVWEGAAGTITATVKPVAPARGVASGSVDFYDDGSFLTTTPLSTVGKAKLPTNILTAGVHTITAEFTGDANFATSTTTTPLIQTVRANTPIAGAVFTPSSVGPGGVSRLVVSATNTGGTRLNNVSLGVRIPLGYTVVSMPRGQLCGARPGLYYCVTSIPIGGTSQMVLQVIGPVAPGAYVVNSYAGNIDTGNETYASATLTVA